MDGRARMLEVLGAAKTGIFYRRFGERESGDQKVMGEGGQRKGL